jgi:hypothetical protein
MSSLPFFEGAILVLETEIAARKPPLHGTADRRTPAPAIGVARTFPSVWVVHSLKKGPCGRHATLLALLERESCAEPNKYEPADPVERTPDAPSKENVPSACDGGCVAEEPAHAHRVEQQSDQKQVAGRAVHADELRRLVKKTAIFGLRMLLTRLWRKAKRPLGAERGIGWLSVDPFAPSGVLEHPGRRGTRPRRA